MTEIRPHTLARTEAARSTLDEMAATVDPRRLADQLAGFVKELARLFAVRLDAQELSIDQIGTTEFIRNWQRVTAIYALVERVRAGAALGGDGGPLAYEDWVHAMTDHDPADRQEGMR